jgi:hypothetical protein
MKKLSITILMAALCSASALAASSTGSTPSLTDATRTLTDPTSTLLDEVRELSMKYAALTSAVAFIERKCESDASWRRAYHQGEAAQAVATNEYGIAYRVTIYNDGYVYADAPKVVPRPASPETAAKAEAARKALIEEKAEAARQAMERAALPARVAEIFAARRAAAKTNEVTVVIRQ